MRIVFRIALFSTFLMLGAFAFGQDKTFAIVARPMQMGEGTIMIVPFENKMMLSDVNREIHNRTGLDLGEIRRLFREGLTQVISNEAAKASYESLDILNSGMEGDLEDIEYVHSSVGYAYENLPEPEHDEKKLIRKVEKALVKEDPDQKGRGVEVDSGEILTYYDGKERFMDAVVYNEKLFNDLNGGHSFDYMLMINELDIKVLRNHDAEMGQIWDRMVKVHYNWFDQDGNKLYGGAAYYKYEGSEKDIYTIIRKSFTPIAQQMLVTLPLPEEEGREVPMMERSNEESAKEGTKAEPKKARFIDRKESKEETEDDEDF